MAVNIYLNIFLKNTFGTIGKNNSTKIGSAFYYYYRYYYYVLSSKYY